METSEFTKKTAISLKAAVEKCIGLVNSKPNWEDEIVSEIKDFKQFFASPYAYDDVIDELRKSSYFADPASTKFHGAFAGGLVKHSLSVLNEFLNFYISWDDISDHYGLHEITLMCLLHDLCKVGYYKEIRDENVKSKWIRNPNKQGSYGHGIESVRRVEKLFSTVDETLNSAFSRSTSLSDDYISKDCLEAIRWHMGWYDLSKYDEEFYYEAKKKNPLVLTLHYADDMSTSWRED